MSLSVEQLTAFAPRCYARDLAPALSAAADERKINTPKRLAHWLGQLSVESAGLTRFTENLSYSTERMMAVWPHRFPTLASTSGCVHNPLGLANVVYAGRLGNTHPGDGYKFRGRGLIMLTGRDNYTRTGQALGLDLAEDPDLAETPTVAARIAAHFWAAHGLNALADHDDVRAITHAINGGEVGLEERKAAVARAKTALGVTD